MSQNQIRFSAIYAKQDPDDETWAIYIIDADGDAWCYYNLLPNIRAQKVIFGLIDRQHINPEYWNLVSMNVHATPSNFWSDRSIRQIEDCIWDQNTGELSKWAVRLILTQMNGNLDSLVVTEIKELYESLPEQ